MTDKEREAIQALLTRGDLLADYIEDALPTSLTKDWDETAMYVRQFILRGTTVADRFNVEMNRVICGQPWTWYVTRDGLIVSQGEAYDTETALYLAASALRRALHAQPDDALTSPQQE